MKFKITRERKRCCRISLSPYYKYQFGFNCDTTTLNKIVSNLNLHIGTIDNNNGSGLRQEFPGSDSLKIETLKPFAKKDAHQAYWYLWYGTSKKAILFFVDMCLSDHTTGASCKPLRPQNNLLIMNVSTSVLPCGILFIDNSIK